MKQKTALIQKLVEKEGLQSSSVSVLNLAEGMIRVLVWGAF